MRDTSSRWTFSKTTAARGSGRCCFRRLRMKRLREAGNAWFLKPQLRTKQRLPSGGSMIIVRLEQLRTTMGGGETLFGWARSLLRCGMLVHVDGESWLGAARLGEDLKS